METEHLIDNQRLTIDVYNTQYDSIEAVFSSNDTQNVLNNAEDYYMVIETAQVALKDAVLTLDADLKIAVLVNKDVPGYDRGYHVFSLTGELKDVKDIDTFLYNTLHKGIPNNDLGVMGLQGENFIMNITSTVYQNAYQNGDFELYCNYRMSTLIPEFLESSEPLGGYQGMRLWKIKTTQTSGTVKQQQYTLDRILDLKRIEFHSNTISSAQTVHVQNTNKQELVQRMNILGSMLINAEDYDIVQKANRIYVPSVLRYVSLTSSGPINKFSIYVVLYYKDGSRRNHRLLRDEFMSMQVSFIGRNNK